jgi:hypothetical protein
MKKLVLLATLASFVAAPAFAQTAAPATPAAKPAAAAPATAAPAAKPAKAERTAKSMECSKQADTQNLHGKPRKKFMSTCKKG